MSPVVPESILASMNIWMEAAFEKFEGKVAVGEVMRNRLKSGNFGKTLVDVILAPYQFSGWNTKDPQRIRAFKLEHTNDRFVECQQAWQASATSNFTSYATFYYNPKVVLQPPAWAHPAKFVCEIGSHFFYRG